MSLGTGAIKVGGGPAQIPGTAGRFHGNPVSGNQPCKWPPTSTITLEELHGRNLPDPIPTMNHFLWGVGRAGSRIGKIGDQSSDPQSQTEQANCQYGDQSSDPSKVVICKDQWSRHLQLWWLEPKCKHMAWQALVPCPQILETAGRIDSRLT